MRPDTLGAPIVVKCTKCIVIFLRISDPFSPFTFEEQDVREEACMVMSEYRKSPSVLGMES